MFAEADGSQAVGFSKYRLTAYTSSRGSSGAAGFQKKSSWQRQIFSRNGHL
jgi:hypothetical protein